MNIEDIHQLIDSIDSVIDEPTKKGRIPLKLFAVGVASILCIGIASAGLITFFYSSDISITVSDTNINIDNNSAPYTYDVSFSDKLPGDAWNDTIWINNSKAGSWYLINLTATSDEGLTVSFLNETETAITELNATASHMIVVHYELSLLCGPDTYNASIAFNPLEAGLI